MKIVAILSDTHGLLREQVLMQLHAADVILHAGDINTSNIVETIRSYGEAHVVQGNNDKEWAKDLPHSLRITIEGVRFFLVHNKKDVPKALADVDVIVYGHSHKYAAEFVGGVLWLNPGSCGKRRFDLDITMCNMTVDKGSIIGITKVKIES
ncbi:MAG: metallophosphoesterase family protein [Angelakisella sp.]|nr:metallophosphoesterase family protein [Angelakisella sp.]